MTSSFKINRDKEQDNLRIRQSITIPVYYSIPDEQEEGSMIYSSGTQQLYYSDGDSWLPLSVSTPISSVATFSMTIDGNKTISPSTPTTLSPLKIPGQPFHSVMGWDLTTGVFTADSPQKLTLWVDISWYPGTNLGRRYLRVIYNGTVLKEADTQADADSQIETTQSLSMALLLSTNDTVYIEVEHTANIAIDIDGRPPPACRTTISGFLSSA